MRELRELAETERREESHSQEGKSGTLTKKTKMNDTNGKTLSTPMNVSGTADDNGEEGETKNSESSLIGGGYAPEDAEVPREGGKTGQLDDEEDDVSDSEEHLSEYFLAIQKVLHDIAAKLTNTHHLICHKTVKGQGKTYLPPNPSRTADANGGKPKDGEVSSEGRESGGGDGEGGDVSSSE